MLFRKKTIGFSVTILPKTAGQVVHIPHAQCLVDHDKDLSYHLASFSYWVTVKMVVSDATRLHLPALRPLFSPASDPLTRLCRKGSRYTMRALSIM